MSKKLVYLKKVSLIIVIIILGSLFGFVGCVSFRTSDKGVNKDFQKKGVDVRIYHKEFEGTSIRYIETGLTDASSPLIIFIHGAPGSSNAFDKFLQDPLLYKKARLISVDRLGYGYSDYGNSEESIARHGRQIKFIMDQYTESSKVILAGHSFGGPIVAKVMMDYPELVETGIMLAPAVDPENEKIVSIAYPTKWKATRWLFSGAIKVSSDEKFSHVEELKKMENDWDKIQKPLIHVHGKKDGLVPYENLPFVISKMQDSLFTPISWDDANHLIIFNRYEKVRDIVLSVI